MCKLHTTMSSKMLLFLVNYNAYCHRLHFEYILLSFYMWLIYIWIHSAANDTVADVHTDKYKVGTVDVILSAAYVRPQGWTLAERFMYQHTGTRATHATHYTRGTWEEHANSTQGPALILAPPAPWPLRTVRVGWQWSGRQCCLSSKQDAGLDTLVTLYITLLLPWKRRSGRPLHASVCWTNSSWCSFIDAKSTC